MSHRDVLGNVVYGLEVKGVPRVERERKAMEMIEMVGLKGHEHTLIGNLSGGMRQRVGIARALANDPEVLLMDEPFSALDPLVRKDMQFELLSLQRKLEKTVVFITHDINEAFKLGDTVAIMRDGRLIQVGTPEEMSANPADDYVRQFINSADMTKVLCAKNVMITPCVVRETDSPEYALREMKNNGVSTAYVVGRHMKFLEMCIRDRYKSSHKGQDGRQGSVAECREQSRCKNTEAFEQVADGKYSESGSRKCVYGAAGR